MYLPGIIGLLIMSFMLGRAWQKHSDGPWDYEQEVYDEGYEEGLSAGKLIGDAEGWNAAMKHGIRK